MLLAPSGIQQSKSSMESVKLTLVAGVSDELVVIELLQYSDYSDGAVRLASFSTSAREFLFPYPSLCPSYVSDSRETLLSRTIAWPVGANHTLVLFC